MADNVQMNPGVGGDIAAADDVGGVKYQVVKLDLGGNGASVPVSGALPVSGTFYQATQPVSGPVTDAQLRASAVPVDLSAASLAALETVSIAGTVPVSASALPLPTGAATETTIAALQTLLTTLAGTVGNSNAAYTPGSAGQLMLARRRDTDSSPAADGDMTILNLDEEGRLKVASKPASYTAVTGNITGNGQTVPTNVERFSNLMIHCTGTFSTVNVTFEGSLNSTNGTNGNWFLVQAIRSSANTIETATGNLSAAPTYAWELSVNALKYFRVRSTAWTSGTQVWTMIPGTYATEPIPGAQISGTQPVSGTVTSTVTPPAPTTPYFLNSAATTNGALVITGTSGLQSFWATNEGATPAYIKLYNKATAPTVGTDVPEMIIPVPAAVSGVPGVANPNIGFIAFRFALGLGIAITGNAVHTDTTAVAAGQVKVKLSRTT